MSFRHNEQRRVSPRPTLRPPVHPRQRPTRRRFSGSSSTSRSTSSTRRSAGSPTTRSARPAANSSSIFQQRREGLICLTYSTVGLQADCDFLLWRISSTPDEFQAARSAINKTRSAAYLTMPHSFLSMTKRSMYIDKLDPVPHRREPHAHHPRQAEYLFVYPFVKTPRLVPAAARKAAGDHGRAHQGRQQVPQREAEHDLQLRPGRPGFRRRVRDAKSRRISWIW